MVLRSTTQPQKLSKRIADDLAIFMPIQWAC